MIVGPPGKVEELGETQVPEWLFEEYLRDLGEQFRCVVWCVVYISGYSIHLFLCI